MSIHVAVIIATRNNLDLLRQCVKSLEDQEIAVEIIIEHDRGLNPLGCNPTRNNAVKRVSKETTHLYFVDDDCVVQKGCLHKLCTAEIWRNAHIGATGGSCISMYDPHFYKKKWRYIVPPMTINNNGEIVDLSSYYVPNDKWYNVDHLRGGNMLVSRKAFSVVGGFSEEFGVGTMRGDTDLCLKLREAGYTLWFNPSARVLHYKKAGKPSKTQLQADEIWREKWKSKQFLGHVQPTGAVLIAAIGTHDGS